MQRTINHNVYVNFFFPPDPEAFFGSLASVISSAPQEYREIFEAFRKNLEAVIWTANMPFHFVQTGVHQRRFEKVLLAEGIRNIPVPVGSPPKLTEDEVLELARKKFRQELSTPEGSDAIIGLILNDLERSIENRDILTGATEVLRQSEVLIWSAFEVLASDLFVGLLNRTPTLATLVYRDERTKKRLQLRDPLSILDRFSFDLSLHMGDVVAQSWRMDDLESIRTAFDVLFPANVRLRDQLQQEALWKLYQRRNLIVHRRSIVDEAYLRNTGDTLPVGTELLVSPQQLEADLSLVRDTGMELICAVQPISQDR
jgi:hypothetical protein